MQRRVRAKVTVADGLKVNFREVGDVALFANSNSLGSVKVICHATKETNSLLGTSFLNRFASYKIQVGGDFQYLELENRGESE
jgi:predicted aspartyl protease